MYVSTYLATILARLYNGNCFPAETLISDVQPFVDFHPSPLSASYDGSATGCIKTTDTVNNQIRMQWNGLRASSNVTNIVLSGRSLICAHHFTKVGIEVDSMGCNAGYALCKIEGSGVDGSCHAACKLRDGQVGQPFNLLLMVTGNGAGLCGVSMNLDLLPAERSVIDDWGAFVQDISAQ
ncbi:hypothetical protein CAPTEDRAFT_185747 [Capitella teleta]|uniref:Uncharacterized protein n=1 Tax=Capitella teleta TaxID=283909 RepID=R7VIA6_CAPTE|nr:hypothetical protein CAPTEDRAFT_185747 [Capitella teleta]|eukprot:ELU18267.1 hypothetical protein CAPTEDRAFT_185747 [Capitella teleta]